LRARDQYIWVECSTTRHNISTFSDIHASKINAQATNNMNTPATQPAQPTPIPLTPPNDGGNKPLPRVALDELLKYSEDDTKPDWVRTGTFMLNDQPLPEAGKSRNELKGTASLKTISPRVLLLADTATNVWQPMVAHLNKKPEKRTVMARMLQVMTEAFAQPGVDQPEKGISWPKEWTKTGGQQELQADGQAGAEDKPANTAGSKHDADAAGMDSPKKNKTGGQPQLQADGQPGAAGMYAFMKQLAAKMGIDPPSPTNLADPSEGDDKAQKETAEKKLAAQKAKDLAEAAATKREKMAQFEALAAALGIALPEGSTRSSATRVDDDAMDATRTNAEAVKMDALRNLNAKTEALTKQMHALRDDAPCNDYADAADALKPKPASLLQVRNQELLRAIPGKVTGDRVKVTVFNLGDRTPATPAWSKKIWSGHFHPDVMALLTGDAPTSSTAMFQGLELKVHKKRYRAVTRDTWRQGFNMFRVSFTQKWPQDDELLRAYMSQMDQLASQYGVEYMSRYDITYRRACSREYRASQLPPTWEIDETLFRGIFNGLRAALCAGCGGYDHTIEDCDDTGQQQPKRGRTVDNVSPGHVTPRLPPPQKDSKGKELCKRHLANRCPDTAAMCRYSHDK
jgi:hypothetical protein